MNDYSKKEEVGGLKRNDVGLGGGKTRIRWFAKSSQGQEGE